MLIGIQMHHGCTLVARTGCSAGRSRTWSCWCADEIGGVPLFVCLLCTCPKKSRGLCGNCLRKQLVSSRPCSLQPSHSLALFSSSVFPHKKTFLLLFFSSLYPRLPPFPSCQLFPFSFSPVVVNFCAYSFLFPDLLFLTSPNFFSVPSSSPCSPLSYSGPLSTSLPLCLSRYLSRLVVLSHLLLQASSLSLLPLSLSRSLWLCISCFLPFPPLPSPTLLSFSTSHSVSCLWYIFLT